MSAPTQEELQELETRLAGEIAAITDEATLETLRVRALGKKGEISLMLKTLGKMSADERKIIGPAINGLKNKVGELISVRKAGLENAALDAQLETERVDVTLPIAPAAQGSIHPVTQALDEMIEIFAAMGFSVAEGPDIEDDFHNFTALNFPEGHPAREMHDTFFLQPRDGEQAKLLRTHTSPVQIRHMMENKPPIRIIIPGRTYRCDSDRTHTPMFHQVEGLVIDKTTHMGHLKGCLVEFIKAFFEVDELDFQFRPHFFPFTEPSAEMDIGYEMVDGNLQIGSGADYMEVLGCGMVHPNVLRNVGLDPDEYQGFAFGMGIDRFAMLKYGIPDLRPSFDADVRWLDHYGFAPLDRPNLAGGLSR